MKLTQKRRFFPAITVQKDLQNQEWLKDMKEGIILEKSLILANTVPKHFLILVMLEHMKESILDKKLIPANSVKKHLLLSNRLKDMRGEFILEKNLIHAVTA